MADVIAFMKKDRAGQGAELADVQKQIEEWTYQRGQLRAARACAVLRELFPKARLAYLRDAKDELGDPVIRITKLVDVGGVALFEEENEEINDYDSEPEDMLSAALVDGFPFRRRLGGAEGEYELGLVTAS